MTQQPFVPTIEAGRILSLRYRVGRCLSQGPLGELYQAHDLIEDRACSIKLVHHTLNNALHPRERLAHEMGVLSRLSHRNILPAFELGCDEKGSIFLAMAPLDGVSLRQLLGEAGTLPLVLVLEILNAVGAALQHTHDRGLVHQDINPSSIFLNDELSHSALACRAIKVLNFGMAREIPMGSASDDPRSPAEVISIGSAYQAPETLRTSSEDVDARADQWSLAALAYQMLTGKQPPLRADPDNDLALDERIIDGLMRVKPILPDHVILAIKKALSKDREQRFIKIQDLLHAMDHAAQVCQRPTREIKLEELPEQTADESSFPEAVPQAVMFEETTREYPTLSMPALLLASAAQEPALDPLPAVSGAWGAVPSRRWWLFGCIAVAMVSIAGGVSLRHLKAQSPGAPSAPKVTTAEIRVEPLLRADEPAVDLPQPSMQRLGARSLVGASEGALLPVSMSAPAKRMNRRLPGKDSYAESIRATPEVEAALTNAQTEYVNGNYRGAVASARAVQGQSPVRSWRIIGAAACYMKNGGLARDAYRRLRAHDWAQRLVVYVCRMNGIDVPGPSKPAG